MYLKYIKWFCGVTIVFKIIAIILCKSFQALRKSVIIQKTQRAMNMTWLEWLFTQEQQMVGTIIASLEI